MVVTGRNKRLEELYHLNAERSEFYHMADLMKPPTLFTPDDHEKVICKFFFLFHALIDNWVQFLFTYQLGAPMELPSFYGQDHERYDDRFLS